MRTNVPFAPGIPMALASDPVDWLSILGPSVGKNDETNELGVAALITEVDKMPKTFLRHVQATNAQIRLREDTD